MSKPNDIFDLCVRHDLSLTMRGSYRVSDSAVDMLMDAPWASVDNLVPLLEVDVIVCSPEIITVGRLTLDGWVCPLGQVTHWCPMPIRRSALPCMYCGAMLGTYDEQCVTCEAESVRSPAS